jgi:hypothetical protein
MKSMMAVRVIETSLLISAVATGGVFAPIVQYQIYRHLRQRHRRAIDGLGVRTPSFLWREDRQADDSSVAFEKFLSSGSHQELKDHQLNVLWQRVRLLRWLSGVGFALLLIALFVFRRDPGSLWVFFMDLGHY